MDLASRFADRDTTKEGQTDPLPRPGTQKFLGRPCHSGHRQPLPLVVCPTLLVVGIVVVVVVLTTEES